MTALPLILVVAGLFLIWPSGSGNKKAFAGALLLAIALLAALAGCASLPVNWTTQAEVH